MVRTVTTPAGDIDVESLAGTERPLLDMSDEDLSFAAAEVVKPLTGLVVVIWSFAGTEAAAAVGAADDDRSWARTEEAKLSSKFEIW